jgi:tRNA (guanine-N7-)-methyltransferase
MTNESQNFQNKDQLIRSFGRIKSRKLSDHKNHLLENLLPNYQVNQPLAEKDELINSLEIGFGFGDFLFENAKNNSQKQCFGFEPHLNGVVNLLAKLEDEPLKNLQISTQDVRPALEKFPDNFFSEIYILFPDPWPKAKHFKRRLINKSFLDKILSPKMKKGGKLVIATDHDSYKIWILNELLSSEKFSWNANSKKDWQIFPANWTVTKYQKKAAKEGRVSVIFTSTKYGI